MQASTNRAKSSPPLDQFFAMRRVRTDQKMTQAPHIVRYWLSLKYDREKDSRNGHPEGKRMSSKKFL